MRSRYTCLAQIRLCSTESFYGDWRSVPQSSRSEVRGTSKRGKNRENRDVPPCPSYSLLSTELFLFPAHPTLFIPFFVDASLSSWTSSLFLSFCPFSSSANDSRLFIPVFASHRSEGAFAFTFTRPPERTSSSLHTRT